MILRKLFLRKKCLERFLNTQVFIHVLEKKRNALDESQPLLMRYLDERDMAQT